MSKLPWDYKNRFPFCEPSLIIYWTGRVTSPQYLLQWHHSLGLWKRRVQNISNSQSSYILHWCFLNHKPQWPGKKGFLVDFSPASFERTGGSSCISQRCLVAASTLMFKSEKGFQASVCLALPGAASSELLLVVALSLGAQPFTMHRKRTWLGTASSAGRHGIWKRQHFHPEKVLHL